MRENEINLVSSLDERACIIYLNDFFQNVYQKPERFETEYGAFLGILDFKNVISRLFEIKYGDETIKSKLDPLELMINGQTTTNGQTKTIKAAKIRYSAYGFVDDSVLKSPPSNPSQSIFMDFYSNKQQQRAPEMPDILIARTGYAHLCTTSHEQKLNYQETIKTVTEVFGGFMLSLSAVSLSQPQN